MITFPSLINIVLLVDDHLPSFKRKIGGAFALFFFF